MLAITAIISFIPHEWESVLMVLRTINVICVWICCDLFRNIAIPRFATITFFVYMMHGEVQKCINKIFEIVLPRNGDIFALINTFGGMILTYLMIYILAEILQKYYDRTWSILNGGRQ